MDKYFVLRKMNTNNQYWSVDKGWVKYEWATVYSQEEVENMLKFGFDACYTDTEWVRHEPPKPTPVIIGEDNPVTVSGSYWCYYKPTNTKLGIIQKIADKTTFLKGYWYVYIPEPNWPA